MSEKSALDKYGYSVLTSISGENAIEAVRDRPEIDLVLMDINLGAGMDGTQAAEVMLRERDIPIIFLSSHSEREIVEKTEKISSYGYVVKNSSITVLDASIKMAFKLFDEKEKSKELNNRLNATLEAIPDLMFVVDKDGYFESYHNTPSPISLAMASDRIIGSNLRDIFPPEEVERQLALYHVCLKTGHVQTHQYELTIDGKRQYFSLQLARLDASHVLSTIHDITLQEEALAAKQTIAERFAFACEAGGIGIWEYDLADGKLVWDAQTYSLFGSSAQRFPAAGDAWQALMHPDDRLRSEQALRQAASGSGAYDDEYRVTWPDGSVHTLRSIARVRRGPDGSIASFIGINLDMTRLRLEEAALQESMAMFTTLFKTIPYPVIIIDAEEDRYIDANDAALQSLGYSYDELLGKNGIELGIASEQNRAVAERLIEEAGCFKNLEMSFIAKGGHKHIGLVSGQLVSTKNRSYVIQTIADITSQKLAERQLLEREARFIQAEKIAKIGSWTLDLATGTIIASQGADAIYGIQLASLPLKDVQQIPLPEYRALLNTALANLMARDIPYDLEFRIQRPCDGALADIHSVARLDKSTNTVLGVIQDITAQKTVEARLRHSTAALDLILNSSAESIYGLDLAYRCTFINTSGLRQLGYRSSGELIGKDMHAMIHHSHADGQEFPVESCRIYNALRAGDSVHSDDEVFWRADGTYFSAEYWAYPQIEGDKLTGFVVSFLDISERKSAERTIQRLLAEKELILRGVHHRIKNNMNTISSLLAIQSDSLPDPIARAALEDAERRVQSMALLYEQLYNGSNVTELSIAEYLSPLIDGIVANFPNAAAIRLEKRLDYFVLDARQMQPLGIIINEVLTNAMKHAFRGRSSGTISIAATENGGRVRLTFHDDGNGIPVAADLDASSGFGIKLMRGLAEQLHGSIQIENDSGTTIVLEFEKLGTGQA